jgi:NADH-quinone oxidoreductase subunit M
MSGLLPMMILLPLLGGIFLLCWIAPQGDHKQSRFVAFAIAAMTLALGLMMTYDVVTQLATYSQQGGLADPVTWPVLAELRYMPSWLAIDLPGAGRMQLALGVEGLGAAMALLTTIVVMLVMWMAEGSVRQRFGQYAGWILLAEAGLLTVFLSMDLVLFYIGFELTLIPLLFLISGWGGEDAGRVAKRFVLYTLAGGMPMLVGLIGLVIKYSGQGGPTVLMEELSRRALVALPTETLAGQTWIFALLVFGLGIKMALLPLHTWLPETYRAAHPTTTALLAAVVVKLGLFDFFRLLLPMLPLACREYGPAVLGTLGAIAIVYGALAALAQTDLRLLLAYSSLSHVGFITLGIFSLSEEGLAGAALQMFNHGITTAAMFLLAGIIIDRRGTASIPEMGHGLSSVYPKLGVLMLFFLFAGAGMPGLNNFIGELLALAAMMVRSPLLAVIGSSGVLFGAWYSLKLARELLFGPVEKSSAKGGHGGDLTAKEWVPLGLVAGMCLWIGCYPQPAMSLVDLDARELAKIYADLDRQELAPVANQVPADVLEPNTLVDRRSR